MFKFTTTAEATKLAEDFQNLWSSFSSRISWNSPQAKDLADYMKFLIDAADNAGDEYNDGDIMFLQNFVEKILPVWKDKVVHDDSSGIPEHLINNLNFPDNTFGVSYSNRTKNYNSSGIINAVNKMLVDAYEKDVTEEVFNSWVSKVTNWMLYFNTTSYIEKVVWSGDYDPVTFSKFKSDKWAYDRVKAVSLVLDKGYTPAQIFSYGVDVAKFSSPETLTYFSTVSSPKVVKSLVGLNLSNREPFTEEILKKLVEVGFESSAEVKNYARKFGVGWNDNDFFTRLINAKTLYPDLNAYTPAV